MKYIALLSYALFFSSGNTFASDLSFHIECQEITTDCKTYKYFNKSKGSIILRETPILVVGRDEVSTLRVSKDTGGREVLMVKLAAVASQKLRDVTGANLLNNMGLVAGEKVLMAPRLNSAILNGELQVPFASGTRVRESLRDIGWIIDMVNGKAPRPSVGGPIMWFVLLFGLALAAGSYFFFYSKPKGN